MYLIFLLLALKEDNDLNLYEKKSYMQQKKNVGRERQRDGKECILLENTMKNVTFIKKPRKGKLTN